MKYLILAAGLIITRGATETLGVPAVLTTLPRAQVTVDPSHRHVVIDLPSTDLPAATAGDEVMATIPPTLAVIPRAIALCSLTAEVLDGAGQVLPRAFLHHVNLNDPSRRDLFVPTQLHILAASKETPTLTLPGALLGLPLERNHHLLVLAMVANPTPTPRRGVHVRLKLGYTSIGPLFRAYPFAMDAMYPLGSRPDGSKAFDLPPGRTTKSWESSPAVPGYVLGIGGHVHDYATRLELADVTTGNILWSEAPIRDRVGHVITMPVRRFYNWHRLGLHIVPSHRYRITVTYVNPTDHVLTDGGMGAVGGLMVPERGAMWPSVDTTNAIYRQDLTDALLPGDMSHMKM